MYFFTIFETVLGWMALVWSPAGLRRVILPQVSKVVVLDQISRGGNPAENVSYAPFTELAEKIKDHLTGKEVEFHCKLDFSGVSRFQQKVYGVVQSIPRGQVRSYSWVACALGLFNSARAVGQALARNPFPIVVPCHRIISSNGSLGGYSGGVELKQRLLKLEGLLAQSTTDASKSLIC